MSRRNTNIAVIVLLLLLSVITPAWAQRTVALEGATLIDGTGKAPLNDAVVIIEGNKIVAVGGRASVHVPAGAHVINAAGKFVIPGLMDANVHLVLNTSIEFVARYEGHYEDLIEEAAQVTLKQGLTTVFDSWGPLQPLMNVRDRINRGEVVGSRMFVAGNIVGFSGPFGRDFNGAAATIATKPLAKRINRLWEENTGPELMWMTPEQVRVEIRKYIARGIDFLKFGASGHHEEDFIMFSPLAQKAIVEECHKAGIIVQTHTTNNEALRLVLEAGVDMLQHGAKTGLVPMPDSTIQLMFDKKVYCAVQPRTAKRLEIEVEDAGEDPRGKKELVRHENQLRLVKARVPLLLATDAGVMDPDAFEVLKPKLRFERLTELGEGHYLWLKAMVEKGMSPMEAIVSATRNIAAAYHKLDQLGTLEKGKLADLVVLEADPLGDINNIRKISLVMKEGQVVDRDKLPIKKVLTVPRSVPPKVSDDSGKQGG
jgi:imidazolonepropionase-like amidohydrolase